MGVDGDEIMRAVTQPQAVRAAAGGKEHRTHGRIGVVIEPASRVVITVVWRYESQRISDVRRAADYGRAETGARRRQRRERAPRGDSHSDARRTRQRRRQYTEEDE